MSSPASLAQAAPSTASATVAATIARPGRIRAPRRPGGPTAVFPRTLARRGGTRPGTSAPADAALDVGAHRGEVRRQHLVALGPLVQVGEVAGKGRPHARGLLHRVGELG